MYITCIYLSYHCLGWYTVRIWVFVCVCCAAPDKLTSPPPFTGLGALHFPRAALLVSHSYCISRNIWVRRRAIGVGHGDSVACAGQRAVDAGRVTAHPS